MSTPTDPVPDELRALRERAYGPRADIQDDPVALARLHELENAGRAAAVSGDAAGLPQPEPGSPPVSSVEPAEPPEPAEPAVAEASGEPSHSSAVPPRAVRAGAEPAEHGAGAPAAADEPTPPPSDVGTVTDAAAPRPWWRRRLALLWPASVVVAVLLGVGLTLGVQALEAGEVAVLHVDPDAEWPVQYLGTAEESSARFEDFYGLSIATRSVQSQWADVLLPCIWVYRDHDSNLGIDSSGCSAGSFPAQASFIVPPGAPIELRERFPVGTALLFVLDGSQVRVYAHPPDVVDPTP